MMKIEFRVSYLHTSIVSGYLHYPSIPYDLAVFYDGAKVIVKPIIEINQGAGFFSFKGKSYFIKNFSPDNVNQIPPDWALNWASDRIQRKAFKVNLRMSQVERFMLKETVKRRLHTTRILMNQLTNEVLLY